MAFAAVAGVGVTQNAAGAGQYQYGKQKVTICHHTHSKKHPFVTITVGAPAVKAHLKHGDHLGACTAAEVASGKHKGKPNHSTTSGTSAPTTGHANGNGNGNNGNGNGNNGNGNNGNGNNGNGNNGNGKGHGK